MLKLNLALVLATAVSADACNLSNVQIDSCDFETIQTTTGCSDPELDAYDIEGLCAEAQPATFPWSDVTKRGYQFDKEFFNGGTIFNTEYESDLTNLGADTARLEVIKENLLTRRKIAWPDHISNFENGSCNSGFAMCCWTADRSPVGEGTCMGVGCQDENPANNTDVCHLDMGGNAARSSHVANGDAFFPGDAEGDVNCNAFHFGDTDGDWSGNLLFEVAFSHGLMGNGYVRNIPGAPMCACMEQMPYVSEASCTDYEVIETESFTINLEEEELKITLNDNGPLISFGDCGGETFSSVYQNVPQVLGTQCDDEIEGYVNDLGYESSTAKWTPVAGKQALHEPYMNDDDFRQIWSQSPHQILRRRCQDCASSHKDIFYKRYDTNGLPEDIDLLWVVKNHWFQEPHNYFHVDFNLFSTYEDALNDVNEWTACNFDDEMIGFPRDCGPSSLASGQYNAFIPKNGNNHGQKNVAFYVELEKES